MNRQVVETALAALGRPPMVFGRGVAGMGASIKAQKEWDAAHPEKAKQWAELAAQLDVMDEREEAAREADTMMARIMRSLGESGAERAATSFGKLTETPALKVARAWLESKDVWLLMLGGVGTGKTVAGVWAYREAALAGQSVAFRLAAQLSRLSGFEEGARELERLKKVDLLVVDDVGAEAQTAWGQGILGELFDGRHQGFKRTIITSNLTADEFKARVGERLADRVREDGQVHRLEGKSLRGRR